MNRIKELRKQAGYSQEKLSRLLSTSQANVSGWELNKWQPDQEALTKLSKIFGVSIGYILCAENERNLVGYNATTKQIVIGEILTDEEKEDLALLRALSPLARKSLRETLRALTKTNKTTT